MCQTGVSRKTEASPRSSGVKDFNKGSEGLHILGTPRSAKIQQMLVSQSYSTLCDPMDSSPPGYGIPQPRILEWVAIRLLQGIFPTQGSNPGLLPCRHILSSLSHRGAKIREDAKSSLRLKPLSGWSLQARCETAVSSQKPSPGTSHCSARWWFSRGARSKPQALIPRPGSTSEGKTVMAPPLLLSARASHWRSNSEPGRGFWGM